MAAMPMHCSSKHVVVSTLPLQPSTEAIRQMLGQLFHADKHRLKQTAPALGAGHVYMASIARSTAVPWMTDQIDRLLI